jgi:hypothetical protein
MLTVVTFFYGMKWSPAHVERLFSGLRRNIQQPFRCAMVTDHADLTCGEDVVARLDDVDKELTSKPGCLVRMRLFDRKMQNALGLAKGDRVVNIDIDAIICSNLDPLFYNANALTIMQGHNTTNPCPFNGSLWMFRAGERHDVWDDFSFKNYKARGVPFHAIPDDQGWLQHKFPDAAAFTIDDGVYAFRKKTWPQNNDALPGNARIVAFPGRRPENFMHLDWVRKHWAA